MTTEKIQDLMLSLLEECGREGLLVGVVFVHPDDSATVASNVKGAHTADLFERAAEDSRERYGGACDRCTTTGDSAS